MKKFLSILVAISIVAAMGISAFAYTNDMNISFQIDNPNMTVNGVSKGIDAEGTAPVIRNNRTLLPVRAAFEEMGGQVSWNGDKREVVLKLGADTVVLTIGSAVAFVNNRNYKLDVEPVIINNRTMLPIRFIAEKFGYKVGWIADTRTVTLTGASQNEVAKTVFAATQLLGKDVLYNSDANITYGQLSKAAMTIFTNESVTVYPGLDAQDIKKPFEHQYAKDFAIVGRDVLGADKVTAENIDKNVTVAQAIDVLTYYLNKRNNGSVAFTKDALIKDADRTALITHKQFAYLLKELDEIAPLLVKIELTSGEKQTNVPVKIEKNFGNYPASYQDYRVILAEFPKDAYNYPLTSKIKDEKPVDAFDFTRDYRDIFLNILSPWVEAASKNGIEIRMSYYPMFTINNGNGYTMRVKVDVLDVQGEKKLTDLFVTADGSEPDIKLIKGASFYCDLENNEEILNVEMDASKLTITGYYVFN